MEGLIEGKAVKYVSQLPGQVGTSEYVALVSGIHREHHPEAYPAGSIESCCDRHEDGDVTLHVLSDTKVIVRYGVPYSAEKAPNSWHWIEGGV